MKIKAIGGFLGSACLLAMAYGGFALVTLVAPTSAHAEQQYACCSEDCPDGNDGMQCCFPDEPCLDTGFGYCEANDHECN